MKLTISQSNKLTTAEQHILWDGIESFTQPIVGDTGRHELCFLLRDENHQVLGGVQGNYDNFAWLWIDSLFVSKSARGVGYGLQLLNIIEAEALKNDCKHSHLTSFSYQAVDFYKKQGYEVFAELVDYPPGHSRCWLKKALTAG
ncbi:MAG: N-acetyltransferase GCN5 [Osedax symbiont Rs1]|nr:MAG: N-acetyltransferase GCN5 [Osedax symbiont Rs1]